MDTKSASAGDLNELERRLAEWQPSNTGLDADGMLFAAGRASVKPGYGRVAWPIVSGCLAVLAGVLLIDLNQERAARLALVAQLREPTPIAVPMRSVESETGDVPSTERPAANSYLASRRVLPENIDAWLDREKAEPSVGPPLPSRPILKARSLGDPLDR